MEQKQEQSVSTTTDYGDEEEQLAGYNCPICGYPIVVEYGLDVCYLCGWAAQEPEDMKD